MHNEDKDFNFEYAVQETEAGFTIEFKGDKEKLRPKLEAFEAFLNFHQKAKAAGFGGGHRHHCKGGFMSNLHSHLKAMHKEHHDKDKKSCD